MPCTPSRSIVSLTGYVSLRSIKAKWCKRSSGRPILLQSAFNGIPSTYSTRVGNVHYSGRLRPRHGPIGLALFKSRMPSEMRSANATSQMRDSICLTRDPNTHGMTAISAQGQIADLLPRAMEPTLGAGRRTGVWCGRHRLSRPVNTAKVNGLGSNHRPIVSIKLGR